MKFFSARYYFLAIFIVWLRGFDARWGSETNDGKNQISPSEVNSGLLTSRSSITYTGVVNLFKCQDLKDGTDVMKKRFFLFHCFMISFLRFCLKYLISVHRAVEKLERRLGFTTSFIHKKNVKNTFKCAVVALFGMQKPK